MGACTSSSVNKRTPQLPLVLSFEGSHLGDGGGLEHEFQFQLSKVVLVAASQANYELSFSIPSLFQLRLKPEESRSSCPPSNDPANPKGMRESSWTKSEKISFSCSLLQLRSLFLNVLLIHAGKTIEIVKENMQLIVQGPQHHDFSFQLEDTSFRLRFDAKISHLFQANFEVMSFSLKAPMLPPVTQAHITLRHLSDQVQGAQSDESYSVLLPSRPTQEQASCFKEERPNVNRLRRQWSKSQEISQQLLWVRKQMNIMPSLTFDIGTQEISHQSLQLLVWGTDENQEKASYIFQAAIPIWKFLQKPHKLKELRSSQGRRMVEQRQVKLNQPLYHHHVVVGTCQMVILMRNQQPLEQLKYCSRTQQGLQLVPRTITNPVPSSLSLAQAINSIEEALKLGSSKTFCENRLITLLHQAQTKISSAGEIKSPDQLFGNQCALLGLIEKLQPFVDSNQFPQLTSLAWNILFKIFEKQQFSPKNLVIKQSQQNSIDQQRRQVIRRFRVKYFSLIISSLKNYVAFKYSSENQLRFFNYCFLRVPSFRRAFLTMLEKTPQDCQIQRRLQEHQREVEPKSCFKEAGIRLALQSETYAWQGERQFENSLLCKRWFMEIGYKDQLFYAFCCSFFKLLSEMRLGGAQKWKQIQGYTFIVRIVLQQMYKRPAYQYSAGLVKASVALLYNPYLVNLSFPIVCDKTSPFDFQQVRAVLDLLYEFLSFVSDGRKMPLPNYFNQNYFFSVLRAVMEGQHFFCVNRALVLIYDFFDLLSQHGRYQIAMFLLGHSFFKLFYHWSKDIRYTFYNILIIKLRHVKHRRALQILSKYNKALDIVTIIQKIDERKPINIAMNILPYKRLRDKVFQKRKEKTLGNHPNYTELQLKNLQKIWQEQNDGEGFSRQTAQNLTDASEFRDCLSHFPSEENLVTPQKKRRTYSQQIDLNENPQRKDSTQRPCSQISELSFSKRSKSTMTTITNDSPNSDSKGRRKRKPSFFLDSVAQNKRTFVSSIVNELHCFSELSGEEKKNIGKAKDQFKAVSDEITQYVTKYSAFPDRNFNQNSKHQIQA